MREQAMESQDNSSSMSKHDIEVLIRLAGIQVADERLPRLTADLEAALRSTKDLDAAADQSPIAGGASFDAAWDGQRRKGRS